MQNFVKLSTLCGFFSMIILLSGCDFSTKEASKNPSLVVINVLDKNYYDDCHIKGSINVPFERLEQFVQQQSWNKDTTELVVYCANYKCTASAEGAKKLLDMGFKKVFAYEGGAAEWHSKGYPSVGSCKEGYLADMQKPEHMPQDVPVITAEELMKKLEQI